LGWALLEAEALPVYLEREPSPERAGLAGEIRRDARMIRVGGDAASLQLLKRRNLRQVDQVAELDPVRADRDAGIVADREVAHRVGLDAGRLKAQPQRHQPEEASAAGDHRRSARGAVADSSASVRSAAAAWRT